ncbi:hypothetical protein ACFY7C_20920 [Streptomyces sp. NPDC012769]|uniref:hypothetical protein n=1 Tax=Streptomyces sp. NPDC012769 TaxID=3364848 RepID=UPI0036B7282B
MTHAHEHLLLLALAATGLVGLNLFLVEATRHAAPAVVGTVIGAVPLVLAGQLTEHRCPAPHRRRRTRRGRRRRLRLGQCARLLLSLGALACEVAFSLITVPLLPRIGRLRVAAYSAALSVPMLLAASLALEGPTALRLPIPGEAAARPGPVDSAGSERFPGPEER